MSQRHYAIVGAGTAGPVIAARLSEDPEVDVVLTAIIIPRETTWLPRSWSFYLVNVITNVLLVGLLTYVAMPTTARVLRRWLY
jgi:hypothetical protein